MKIPGREINEPKTEMPPTNQTKLRISQAKKPRKAVWPNQGANVFAVELSKFLEVSYAPNVCINFVVLFTNPC